MTFDPKNNPKSIRKICLVSSTLFNLSACVYGWTAPIGAALGCVASLTNDFSESTEAELQETIEEAFQRTKEKTSSSSHFMILEEIVCSEITPGNLRELIQETEAFRTQYCTDKDTEGIVNSFEMYFRECVSQHPNLSQLYILSTGATTLEQLKQICKIMGAEQDKLESVKEETGKISQRLERFNQLITTCAQEIALILVSMSVFLITGIISKNGFVQFWLFSAIISYAISGFLMQLLKRNKGNVKGFDKVSKYTYVYTYFGEQIFTLILPILISLACFLMIVMSVDHQGVLVGLEFVGKNQEPAINIAIVALMGGSLASGLMRPKIYKQTTT